MAAKPANLSSFFISIYLRYAPKNRFWIEAAMFKPRPRPIFSMSLHEGPDQGEIFAGRDGREG